MTNLADIADTLRPGLKDVFGMYDGYDEEWREIYTKKTSDKNQEIELEMQYTSIANTFNEGAPIPVSNMKQGNKFTYVHKNVGLQTIFTRNAIEDNLYKSQFPQMTVSLKKSMSEMKNTLGAALLNNGFLGQFPIGDGQPFFSPNHPISNGVVANTFTVQADLNEAALEAMITLIGSQTRDVAGIKTKVIGMKLITGTALQFTSSRLLNSKYRTGTPNGDINAINHGDYLPKGSTINHYLTNPAAWYILTNAPSGLQYMERRAIEVDVYSDFDNKNLKTSADERYSFGVSNFRSMFASSGA